MKKRWLSRGAAGYVALLVACYGIATVAGWFVTQVDYDAYDWMFRLNPPQATSSRSIVLAIDDATLNAMGGTRSLRTILASALERLAKAGPKLVATDLILTDKQDEAEDLRLERALCATPNLVMATDLAGQTWERPLPRFEKCAAAVGHAVADLDSPDGVTRQIPLEVASGRQRRMGACAGGVPHRSGCVDDTRISRRSASWRYRDPRPRARNRPMRIRYLRGGIPQVSLKTLVDEPKLLERFRGKAVFVGVYSMTAARDRVVTPLADRMTGMEVNAQAFETLERGEFFVDASNLAVLAYCSIVAILAGLDLRPASGMDRLRAGSGPAGGSPRRAVPSLPPRNCLPVLRFFVMRLVDASRARRSISTSSSAVSCGGPKTSAPVIARPSISSRTRCARR